MGAQLAFTPMCFFKLGTCWCWLVDLGRWGIVLKVEQAPSQGQQICLTMFPSVFWAKAFFGFLVPLWNNHTK